MRRSFSVLRNLTGEVAAAAAVCVLFVSAPGIAVAEKSNVLFPHASCLVLVKAGLAEATVFEAPAAVTGVFGTREFRGVPAVSGPETAADLLEQFYDGRRSMQSATRPSCRLDGLNLEQLQKAARAALDLSDRIRALQTQNQAEQKKTDDQIKALTAADAKAVQDQYAAAAILKKIEEAIGQCKINDCANNPEIVAKKKAIADAGKIVSDDAVKLRDLRSQKVELERKAGLVNGLESELGPVKSLLTEQLKKG